MKKLKTYKLRRPIPKPEFGYKVEVQTSLDYSDSSGEGYDHSYVNEYSNEFKSITISDKYPDVLSSVDLTKQSGYLVWLDYSTGDSVGCNTRERVEFVGILPTEKIAKELVEALKSWQVSHPNTLQESYQFIFQTKDNQVFEYKVPPWAGYFNHIDGIYIQEVKL